VRIPEEFLKASDTEIVIRLQTEVTGRIEASSKLADVK